MVSGGGLTFSLFWRGGCEGSPQPGNPRSIGFWLLQTVWARPTGRGGAKGGRRPDTGLLVLDAEANTAHFG